MMKFDEKYFELWLKAWDRASANRERLAKLAQLIEEGRSDKETVLQELFPDKPREKAQSEFRKFKERVNKKAAERGIPLAVVEKGGKVFIQSPEPTLNEEAVAIASGAAALLEKEPVPMRARPFIAGRPLVEIFVSYAQKDKRQVKELLTRLEAALYKRLKDSSFAPELEFLDRASSPRLVGFWRDEDKLEPGEDFKREIQDALRRSVFGLFMVSPDALRSPFIRDYELPELCPERFRKEGDKPACSGSEAGCERLVPILLKEVRSKDEGLNDALKRVCLDGIHVHHLDGKPYAKLRGKNREHFVEALAERLARRIEAYLRSFVEAELESLQKQWLEEKRNEEKIPCPQDAQEPCSPVTVRGEARELSEDAKDILKAKEYVADAFAKLWAWALEDKRPLAVVLGEYGMGKTTLTRWLTRELLKERKGNSSLPLPIYFDLRHLSKETREKPKLKAILQELIENWYQSGGVRDLVTPEQVAALVRSGRAIVIFDGLDEVLVYLTPEEGRRFVRELWSITYDLSKRVGRAIMTTRTHYFRTLWEAVSYFTGEDREGISGMEYLALFLLPFNEEQIRTYFEQSFGDKGQAERAMALVKSVYNLSELAKRPYLLRLIWEHYEELEQLKAEGFRVSAARFYETAVDRWIRRDDPKHQIKPDHKRLFMEHLAAELWKSGERSWNVGQVETWFSSFLMQNPGLKARYGDLTPEFMERLIEDLRTATFIVHDGVDRFRFAHTSLQEFFLASYLLKAILEERYERWDLPTPSPETFDFLTQLWRDHKEREKLFKNARAMGQRPLGRANENLVRFLFFARERYEEFKGFSFARFHLEGANLVGLEFGNPDPEGPKVNWARAVFDGAKFRDARFTNANLDGASFKGADLTRAEFWKARAVGADFEGARLVGAFFREAGLRGARFDGGHFRRTKWVRTQLKKASGLPTNIPEGFFVKNLGIEIETKPEACEGLVLPRHFLGGITALASDQAELLAAGNDAGNIRLWDTNGGEPIWEWGMPDSVYALAFAAKGEFLAAGDLSGNLELYDLLRKGGLVWRKKMPDSIFSITSIKENMLAVGDDSGNLWIWDTWNIKDSEPLMKYAMPQSVRVATTSNAGYLITGDDEGNIWIWDAESGHRLWELKMPESVRALSVFEDLLVAGDKGGNLWLWDIEAREQIWEEKIPSSILSLTHLNNFLIVGDKKGNLRLFDITTGDEVWKRKMPASVNALAVVKGDRLASGDDKGNVLIWDMQGEEVVRTRKAPLVYHLSLQMNLSTNETINVLRGSEEQIYELNTLNPISNFISLENSQLIATDDRGNIWLWDFVTGKRIWQRNIERSIRAVAALRHKRLAVGDDSGDLWLLDAESGEQIYTIKIPNPIRATATFNSEVLAVGDRKGNLWLWDVKSLEKGARWIWKQEMPDAIFAITPIDDDQLAAGDDSGNLSLWDLTSKRRQWKLKMPDSVRALSTQYKWLIAGDWKGNLWFLESESGKLVHQFKMPSSILAIASFRENQIVVGDRKGNLWVLNVTNNGDVVIAIQLKVPASIHGIAKISFQHFAVAGNWGSVLVFKVKTGKRTRIEQVAEFVRAPDGEYLSAFGNKIVAASPRAWRWAYVRGRDAEGRIEVYPYEAVDDLPTS